MKENRRVGILNKAQVLLDKAAGKGTGNVRFRGGSVVMVMQTGQIVCAHSKLRRKQPGQKHLDRVERDFIRKLRAQ